MGWTGVRVGVRVALVLCSTASGLVALPAVPSAADAGPCGTTTLEARVADVDGDGVLECGPSDDLVVRNDLAKKRADEERKHLTSFLLFADFQLGDEELTLPSRTDWRTHAALVPHMLNAHLKGASALAAKGGPVLGEPYDLAFALGDLADNAQYNETRLMMELMDGGALVDPDSGADTYDGVRVRDPVGAGSLRSPVAGESILDLANEPFYAQGLRNADGSRIPWYAVHGNHDSKVMGSIPHDDADWRRRAETWATGNQKIFRLHPRLQAEANRINLFATDEEVAFWTDIFERIERDPSSVGDVRTVPADPDRRILSKQQWMDELANDGDGHPSHVGEGDAVCPDVYEDEHARRACYVVDHGKFRFIALDDNPLEGGSTGSIDRAQMAWLEDQLTSASSVYFDEDGERVTDSQTEDRYVVVLTHHTQDGISNSFTTEESEEADGKELSELLLRFPNVIVLANGHTHTNKIWPRRDTSNDTAYWEVNVASLADHPHNGRSIEIVDNADGTLSIFGVLFESGVHPDPRGIDWTADDLTDEVLLGGADRTINEDWLAAAGMEQALTEADLQRAGIRKNRNVELVIRDPLFGRARPLPVRRDQPVQRSGLGGGVPALAGLLLAALVAAGVLAVRRRRAVG